MNKCQFIARMNINFNHLHSQALAQLIMLKNLVLQNTMPLARESDPVDQNRN